MSAKNVSAAEVQRIPTDKIVVGERRRKKLGRIADLAKSIKLNGLIHPILVRNGNELVSGQRRLEACKKLDWKTIPARSVETLSSNELRAIELAENTKRDDLDSYEKSKERLAEIEEAKKTETPTESVEVSKKKKRGPAKRKGSRSDVAEKTGTSPTTQREIEAHVEIADAHPYMKANPWVQHSVLEAGKLFNELPEAEHARVDALLDQPAIPPKSAIGMLHNLKGMTAKKRKSIYALNESGNNHDRRSALSEACELPPVPYDSLDDMSQAVLDLRRALGRPEMKKDWAEIKPRIAVLCDEAVKLKEILNEKWKEKRDGTR